MPSSNFQQCLLHALAGHVARDGGVLALAGDLIHLVDIDDAALRQLNVEVCRLQQAQENVLDILADIACFGERGRIGDGERNVQDLASVCAKSVLPQPVGPMSRILLFCSSTSESPP